MKTRAAFLSLAGLSCLVAGIALAAGFGLAATVPARISFVIATGPTGGTYFPVGQAIANIVSNPPGSERCRKAPVCGPPGMIASVRSSPGAAANVLSVNAGQVDAGLAQSDVVADALAGRNAFRTFGKLTHIRVVANLFSEQVHLVVAKSAHVKGVSDLRGKRVGIGADNSGTALTVRALLAAYRMPERRFHAERLTTEDAAEAMQRGKLDAFFFVGGAPVTIVQDLASRGIAEVVPLTGAGAKQLLKTSPTLSAQKIPAGLYGNAKPIETVGMNALLIVNDEEPEGRIYFVTRALFNGANREDLGESHESARQIALARAAKDSVAPLHAGAVDYYRETGKLPKAR